MALYGGPQLKGNESLVFHFDPSQQPNQSGGLQYFLLEQAPQGSLNIAVHPENSDKFDALVSTSTLISTGVHKDKIEWSNNFPQSTTGLWVNGFIGLPSYFPPSTSIVTSYEGLHNFVWVATGQVYLPAATWLFRVDGDDNCDVDINGTKAAIFYGAGHGFFPSSNTFNTGSSITISTAGWYTFRARVEEGGGNNGLAVGWTSAGTTSTLASIPASNYRPFYGQNRAAVYPKSGIFTHLGSGVKTDNTVFEGNGTDSGLIYPNDTALDSNTITIEAWIKRSLTSQNGHIFEKGNVNTQYSLLLNGNTCYFRTVLSTGSDDLTFDTNVYLSTVNWNHIVATYTSGTKKLYVNGVEVASSTPTGTITTNANGMSIGVYGGYNGARDFWYTGQIGLVRVYNAVLAQPQIQQNFTANRNRYGL
jgi:hypothetical protein